MKVKELIEILKEFDPEKEIIIGKDSEGNSFSPLDEQIYAGLYCPDSTWSGEFYEDSTIGDEEYFQPDKDNSIEVICLYPIN